MNKENLYDEIILTIPQAAILMHTDINKGRSLVKKGYIKGLKLKGLKIRRAEIDRFLKDAEGKDFSDLENIKELVL